MKLRDESEAGKRRQRWGEDLQALRKRKGFRNAPDLAAKVGVSKRTVENWEAGDNWPAAEHLAQLVRVLGPEADPGAVVQLSRIEEKLDGVVDRIKAIEKRSGKDVERLVAAVIGSLESRRDVGQ